MIHRLFSLAQGICSMEYSRLKIALEKDFEYFSAAADFKESLSHKKILDEKDVDEQEKRFLVNLMEILRQSHYDLLSKEEWNAASEEDFLLTLPVIVKWNAMDDKMLKKAVWNEHPEMREELPENIADRILVFHRGVDTVHLEGKYFPQKVDLLLSFCIIQPIIKCIVWLMDRLRLRSSLATAASSAYLAKGDDAAEHVDGEHVDGKHTAAIDIERRTFARTFPNAKTTFKSLLKKVSLQEACWKDVVVVYRKASAANSRGELDLVSNIDENILKRNIVVKRFRSIPIADMELVFPEKNIHLPPQVLLNIGITLLGAVLTVFSMIRGGLSYSVMWTMLTMLGTRLGQVYNTAITQKTTIERSMQKLLYEHNVASSDSAISSIIDDMYRQQTRIVIIAYCMLLYASWNNLSMNMEQLDEACEDMLRRRFSLNVDFTCEKSIKIMQKWGIVSIGSDGTILAVNINECLEILQSLWVTTINEPRGITDRIMNIGPSFGEFVQSTASSISLQSIFSKSKSTQATDEQFPVSSNDGKAKKMTLFFRKKR